jgi:lysozyme family protein
MTINHMLTVLIAREGGYVDHPDDKGGPTKFGITIAALSEWRHKECTAEDVRELEEPEARSIYTSRYFIGPGYGHLENEDLQALLLDCAAQFWHDDATRWLQNAVGVPEDGVCGPHTIMAANKIEPWKVMVRIMSQRIQRRGQRINKHREQAEFAEGWANRDKELLDGITL